jgi:Right handed beta helix region
MKVPVTFLLSPKIVLLTCLASNSVYGATYYVTQAQSVSTAKLTIAAGLGCMAGGDTLVIRAGTYAEFINGNQIVSGKGSWDTATTIKAAPGEIVTLRPTTGGGGGDAVWIYGRSYVIVDGLIIDATNVPVQGVRINVNGSTGSSFIRIVNSEIKNVRNSNCIGAAGKNIEIINNKIHDCGSTKLDHGIYFNGDNNLAEGNEIYNSAGYGIHQYSSNGTDSYDNNIIRYNYVHHNGDIGTSTGSGILIGSGTNNMVYGNIVTHNVAHGIQVGYNSTTNSAVYNNTSYANRLSCITILSSSTGAKIKNNLCLLNSRNEINNSGMSTIHAKNRLSTDSALVIDAANNRFSPREGSALIDAGEIIPGFSSGNFVGAAPDQGAIEASIGSPIGQTASIPKAPISLQVGP